MSLISGNLYLVGSIELRDEAGKKNPERIEWSVLGCNVN